MILKFLKENGYPMTIIVETKVNTDEYYNDKYISVIKDENGNVLDEFKHKDLRARIHWINGFYKCLKLIKP